jgi:CBS domain-containing protein
MMDDASSRFLDAFVAIEKHLRTLHKAPRHTTFSELVEKTAVANPVVRRLKISLKDFAEFRNFLVHDYSRTAPLAIPSHQTVERIEALKEKLLSPPSLIAGFRKQVETCDPDDSVGAATGKMHRGSFSQLPVYHGRRLIGLLTAETVARWLASRLVNGAGILEEETVAKVLEHQEGNRDYELMGHEATSFDALAAFEDCYDAGRLLDAIILTPHASREERPSGIVTVSDIPDLQKHVKL